MAERKKTPTIEEGFKQLEEMVRTLERDDIELETSFKIYEEGMKLLKSINGRLDQVEKKMKIINGDGGEETFE